MKNASHEAFSRVTIMSGLICDNLHKIVVRVPESK
jgi:hypothetical protein